MFEPGYTPRGWERGCTLDVALPPRFKGVRTFGEMQRATGLVDVVRMGQTHTVKFTSDDVPQLRAWLMWWYAYEPRKVAEIKAHFRGWE